MEAILQGWLTKSPPEKKQFKLFGSKWRKRYFVLYAPPTVVGIPDACTAILEYYSSKKLHNKCGTINLSDCEEVLSNLDSEFFEHVFGLRTMHKSHLRTYYLAAATEVEMNKWVNRLCQVLGLTENDDTLSPQLPPHHQTRPGLPVRSLLLTQPLGIPGSTRQVGFQPRPLTHQANFGQSSGLLSPAPPPLRLVPSTPAAPFSRLNISEPNLLETAKSYPENFRDVADDGLRMASPPGSSRLTSPPGAPSSLKSAGSFPELDRFSPTIRKAGHLPGEGREFMELPPIPPEKTASKTVPLATTGEAEPIRDMAYDLPKQKYYERNTAEEKELKDKTVDDWYNSPPSRYNTQHSDNSFYNSPPSRYNTQPSDNSFYNSPPSRYNSALPPKGDFYNVPPPDRYNSKWGDHGMGASEERIQVDGQKFYNAPQNSSDPKEERGRSDGFPIVPPLKPKRFPADSDDCYNVPRPSTNWSDRQTGVANWNQGQVNGTNWNDQQVGNWWNVPQNSRQDNSDDCYNIPKSQQDVRKHVSQGEEFYNIPKSFRTGGGGGAVPCDLPRQKSDRRSYGGRVSSGFDQDRSSHYRPRYDPSEDYDMPKRVGRPESGHGDLGLYNIPGLAMSSTDNGFYNRPQSIWERTPLNGDRQSETHAGSRDAYPQRQLAAVGLHGGDHGSNDPYNVPPSVVSSTSSSSAEHHLQQPDVMKQPPFSTSHPSPAETKPPASNIASDSKLVSVGGDDPVQSQVERVEMEEGGKEEKSTELKKTPSGAYKQNKAVQSSTSIHKKQGVGGGLPLHDSIRFTQRTKSFKRSIPSQDRSTLPLPVKRIVERSESSSSSSSDDESDQNNSSSAPRSSKPPPPHS